MLLSVTKRINPLTKSRKLSKALVMILSEPLLIAAKSFTPADFLDEVSIVYHYFVYGQLY